VSNPTSFFTDFPKPTTFWQGQAEDKVVELKDRESVVTNLLLAENTPAPALDKQEYTLSYQISLYLAKI
jgi:hypothetical protein